MKKAYLLILLCCASSTNIFTAEKKEENIKTKQDQYIKENIEGWKNIVAYEQKKREEKLTEHSLEEKIDYWTHMNEINELNQNHALEIAMYQEKITALMADRQQCDPGQLASIQVIRFQNKDDEPITLKIFK